MTSRMSSAARALVSLGLVFLTGCAGWRMPEGFVTADSSNNSSNNSSDNSSGNSDNSSGASADSSGDSANSSQNSADSSDSSRNSSGEGGSSDINASSNASSRQSSDNTTRQSGQSSAVVSGVGLLLTTTAATGFAIYGTVMLLTPKPSTPAVALRYLRANEDQLRQDLALGYGPTLDDLASAAEIRVEHAARFRQLLQTNRKELLDLADGELLTADRALRFLSRIGELAWADEELRRDAEDFRARHQG